MKIAIPVEGERLSPHFGGASLFSIVEVDPVTKTILRSEALPPPEHQPGAFPVWLRQQGVTVVIAGGIGQRALALFAQQGITVRAGQPGAPAMDLVREFLSGNLNSAPDGCAGHGHHHDHGHGDGHHDCHRH